MIRMMHDVTFKICVIASKDVGKKKLAKKLHQEESLTGLPSGVYLLSKTIEIYNEVVMLQLWVFLTIILRITPLKA